MKENDQKLGSLFNTEGNSFSQKNNSSYSPSKLQSSKYKTLKICKSLSNSPESYIPELTVKSVSKYLSDDRYVNRILYSQISAFIFSSDEETLDSINANTDALVNYVLDADNCDDNVRDSIIKISDHISLAFQQKVSLSDKGIKSLKIDLDQMQEELKKTKTEYETSIKKTQQDYITIFGIFSAIIITFVGGISFTSATLESMNSASIFRLILVICLLGMVLFNVVYLLLFVIIKVSKLEFKVDINFCGIVKTTFPALFNAGFILILFFDVLFYFIHAEQIRNFIDWLPWN